MRTLMLIVLMALMPLAAHAQSVVSELPGWRVLPTEKSYATLLADLKAAVSDNKMGLVTEAGPTEVAKKRGETIPGNRVVGVFRNDFAVTVIRAAPAAMIEAPIRFMVMEEPDGTATLAYRLPSVVLAPYAEEGGTALAAVSGELDNVFSAIADAATQ
ncbi:MAG: hypothetical protein AcusKO_14800 [Acuticoccus sp.]